MAGIAHAECSHPNTQQDRWKCRAKKRHAQCTHEQKPGQWRKCEDAARAKARES